MKWKNLVAAALAFPALALSQGLPPPGQAPRVTRSLDPGSVATVSGTVTAEKRVDAGDGHSGVQVVVKTAQGEVAVHLGPDSYVDQQSPRIVRGDAVTVTGFRVTVDDRPAIVAQTVTVGGKTITFRDPRGAPAWAKTIQR